MKMLFAPLVAVGILLAAPVFSADPAPPAKTATGTVTYYDEFFRTVVLDGKKAFAVDENLDVKNLKVGQKIEVTYKKDEEDGEIITQLKTAAQ